MSRNKDPIYQVRYGEDALDGETISVEDAFTEPCSLCGVKTDHDGSVYACDNTECPCDVKSHYDLEYNQELDFND